MAGGETNQRAKLLSKPVKYMQNNSFIHTYIHTDRQTDIHTYCTCMHAPVVQRLDSAIHCINHYQLVNSIAFDSTYLPNSDLCGSDPSCSKGG